MLTIGAVLLAVHLTISFNNLNKVNAEIRAGRAGPEQRRVWLWLLLLWFAGFVLLAYAFRGGPTS
jgi:hypothetical protein